MTSFTSPPPTSVFPGRLKPSSLVVRMLQDAAFAATTRRAAELLCQLLLAEGYEIGPWEPLGADSDAGPRVGWHARFVDPVLEQPLALQFYARVALDGGAEVHTRVLNPETQPVDLVAGVCVASTAPLRDWEASPDPLQRLSRELETQMSFIELAAGPGRGTLRAIRVAKKFHEPATWVPDAAQVVLAALSLS